MDLARKAGKQEGRIHCRSSTYTVVRTRSITVGSIPLYFKSQDMQIMFLRFSTSAIDHARRLTPSCTFKGSNDNAKGPGDCTGDDGDELGLEELVAVEGKVPDKPAEGSADDAVPVMVYQVVHLASIEPIVLRCISRHLNTVGCKTSPRMLRDTGRHSKIRCPVLAVKQLSGTQ